MDPEPKDFSWRDRLFHQDQEFPLTYTSTDPGEEAAASAWQGTAHLDEFRTLAESILEHERQAGVLLILADPDDVPAARAYGAICVARLLAERGQRVLIAQTHAAEQIYFREDDVDEAEGFVDLVLYGVSPSITCRPTRLPRIDMLALGSYRPEPGHVYPEDELRRAFDQLRSAYDIVLMLAPARTMDGGFNPLLPLGDAVVLVTGVKRPEALEALRDHLQRIHVDVWGAVVFTSETETVDLTVEGALEEKPVVRSVVVDAAPPLVIHDGRSSPVFRRLALGVAVVLLGFVGWWAWMQFLRGEDPTVKHTSTPVLADAGSAPDRLPSPARNETAPGESGSTQETEAAATLPATASEPEAGASDPRQEETVVADQPRPSPVKDPSADVAFEEPQGASSPAIAAAPSLTPPAPTPSPQDRLLRLLKAAPGGGFGLYVWSFPDSLEAVGALQKLRKDGFEPAVVAADIEGRGRWYRVVVGRFATRQEALDARDILTQRPDVDWAGLVHVN